MRPFSLETADDLAEALRLGAQENAAGAHVRAPMQYLAGGTNLLDLMKLDVMRPERLVNINGLQRQYGMIEADGAGLTLGALARMSAVADDPVVRRDYRVLSDALRLAASQQLRNMASLAGNVLQRTRCNYFRDTSWGACNKREPGSGCAAMEGVNRRLAVLGVSDRCIANYPGDFANALAALGAEVTVLDGAGGTRTLPFEELHRLPGDTPHIETNLKPGELITGFRVPAGPWTRRSLYLKIRDRESFDFALTSAAVALDLGDDGTVREARIGIGGLVAKPWRSHEAEAALRGRRLDEASAAEAAEAAFADAVVHSETAFKPELGRRTLVRALLEAARLTI
ncbi:xanthine dehydrogenase family protein subunit M [Azospirillum sp. SYSU D00513]|uniref:FAD binding domain-containing protein n=1 Tax=Azospirillum sp. SYSU D00513 TaxID=2812561 RepID=UPI001A977C31|nr:xanthine dehydrogenase family protein subunit M [Azospirillum sp. SYSU D00513]